MQALVTLLTVPLMLLNLFGGIGSGIWLAILGEWWAIGYGIAALFVSHFFLGIILMPGLLVGAPAAVLLEKGKTFLAFPFVSLSLIYTYAIIIVWCMFVFYFFISKAGYDAFFPLLIWSYGVALGPWMYMARADLQTDPDAASIMTTFFAQVAYIIIALVAIFSGTTFVELGMIFGSIMLVAMLIQTGIAFASLREAKRLGMLDPD